MASGSLYKAPIPSCAWVSLSGPGGHRGSNSAACVTGIFTFHGNRQVLIPWSGSFACLSSYGISKDLDGFFVRHLKARFQAFSPLMLELSFFAESFFLHLRSLSMTGIEIFLSKNLPHFDLFDPVYLLV